MSGIETGQAARESAIKRQRVEQREGDIPDFVLLEFPDMAEFRDRKLRRAAGLDIIMLGALADRGNVLQKVTGIEPIELHVSDFPPFPVKKDATMPLFEVDGSTIRFLRSRTRVMHDEKNNITEGRVKNWFNRSFTLWNRFMRHTESRDSMALIVNKTHFPVSSKGLLDSWAAAGLPEFINPAIHENGLHVPHKH